jgi:cytoskeletal protein CcmA (bactofilin family)
MADPQDFPLNPNGSVTVHSWAELGAASEPSSGRKDTGMVDGEVYAEDDVNWPAREAMRIARALFSRFPKASDALFGSWMPAGDFGIWVDGPGALEVYLSDSGLVDSIVADVWIDPADVDTGAVRVQVTVPLAGPQTLVASRDTYVFVPNTMITPPAVTRPELSFLDVPIGDPAPATPAGMVPVWRIETDAGNIVDQEILLQRFPVMKTIGFAEFLAAMGSIQGDFDVGGDLDVGGELTVQGDTVLGSAGASTDMNGPTLVDGTFDVTGASTLASAAVTGLTTTNTLTCTSTATFNGNMVMGNSAADLLIVVGTMTCAEDLTLTSALVANGDCSLGNASGDTILVKGTSTFQSDVAVTTSGATAALEVTNSGAGNALRVVGDSTSPTRSPFVIVPVDTDPATTQVGSLFPQSSRGNVYRHHDGSNYRSIHSSAKGFVVGVSAISTGTNVSTTGDIGDITITPEETGTVVLLVTGSWCAPTTDDDTTMTILLKDITGAVTIVTSQAFITMDRDAEVGSTRYMPFVYRYTYTLPSAASRLFRYRLNFAANGGVAVLWNDVMMTVEGVF